MRNGQEELVLPETAEGTPILWDVRRERTPEKLLLLGILIALCVPLVEKSKREEREKQRKELLTLEYPELVSRTLKYRNDRLKTWSSLSRGYTNTRIWTSLRRMLYENLSREFILKPPTRAAASGGRTSAFPMTLWDLSH